MNNERHPYDEQRGGRSAGGSGNPAAERPDHVTADPGSTADELDDRLLALALGLEDGPELRTQLAESVELRARFERLQDELAAVEDGVLRAVPPQPADWADLSDERWSALRPFVGTGQVELGREARRRAGRWRRWQALAPVATAAVIAVAVLGVVMSRDGLQPFSDMGGSGSAPSKAAEGSGDLGTAAQPTASARSLAIAGAAAFDTVVVARASAVADGSQTYTIERTLKGSAPAAVKLETEVEGEVASGSLAVLFLDPRTDVTPCPTPQTLGDGESAPPDAPSPSPAVAGSDGRNATPLYLYDGRCARVLTLPEGVAAGDVQLR